MSFISIRLSSLRDGLTVPFNTYIKVSNNFVQYLHQGDSFEKERLEKLKQKGLKKFYIQETDEKNYYQFLDNILDGIKLDSSDVKTSIAIDVVQNSSTVIVEKPTDEIAYNMAKNSTNIVQKLLSENKNLLREMVSHERSSNHSLAQKLQSHLINTASISIKFAEHMKANIDINSLGVAAFYHDVAFTRFSAEDQKLFFKEVSEMSVAEMEIYKTHPVKSAEFLQDKSFADKNILDLIATHEERISGQGFPNKITKLSLAQEILSLCAFYDREITCLGKNPADVRGKLMIDQLGNFNLNLLKSFNNFIKDYL